LLEYRDLENMRQDRRSGSLVRYIRCGKKFVTSNGKNATNLFPYLIFTNFRFNSVILIILKYVLLLFNYFKLNTAAKNNLTSFTYYLKKVTEFLDGIIVFKELFLWHARRTHTHKHTYILDIQCVLHFFVQSTNWSNICGSWLHCSYNIVSVFNIYKWELFIKKSMSCVIARNSVRKFLLFKLLCCYTNRKIHIKYFCYYMKEVSLNSNLIL